MTAEAHPRLRRVEDARLLSGQARFVDDIHLDRMVYAVFVRSPHAHAEIVSINVKPAIAAGAVAVMTADDLPFIEDDLTIRYWHPSIRRAIPKFLARHRVRHVGEAIAIVIAADRYFAEDYAALVDVEYNPLPPVPNCTAAMRPDASQLHENWTANVAATFRRTVGAGASAVDLAPRRIKRQFSFGRMTAVPLETRGCVADYDHGHDALTVWISTQTHYAVRQNLSDLLRIPEYNVRVIAEDVGGGFGAKSRPYLEEIVVAHASRALRRPVKWIEDRLENLQATTHARGIDTELEFGFDDQGRILGMRGRLLVDVGAYVFTSGIVSAEVAASHCTGPYNIPNIALEVVCVGTNKTPLATYRGAGQPEATFPLECMLDLIARDVGCSAVAVRQLNVIRPTDMPYDVRVTYASPNCRIESGDYPAMLRKGIATSGYHEEVEVLGHHRTAWGLAFGMESTGLINFESAKVQIDGLGRVLVYSGLTSHGQGQATTLTRTCANALGVLSDMITVRMGDTQLMTFGRGSFASRGAVMGANAVYGAAIRLREKALLVAGQLLQCDPTTLSIVDGKVCREGHADSGLALGDLARAVQPGGSLHAGAMTLEETFIYDSKNLLTFSVSLHAARVSLDCRTGSYRVVDYAITHDAGVMLDELIVEGQLIGAAIDGIGGTMLSEILYDDEAQLLTGSLADYLVATAPTMPRIRLDHIQTIPTTNPLGVRGVGEGGIIAVAPAIVNALRRALAIDLHEHQKELFKIPLKPETLLQIIQNAKLRE